jgi:hypothetical protein
VQLKQREHETQEFKWSDLPQATTYGDDWTPEKKTAQIDDD